MPLARDLLSTFLHSILVPTHVLIGIFVLIFIVEFCVNPIQLVITIASIPSDILILLFVVVSDFIVVEFFVSVTHFSMDPLLLFFVLLFLVFALLFLFLPFAFDVVFFLLSLIVGRMCSRIVASVETLVVIALGTKSHPFFSLVFPIFGIVFALAPFQDFITFVIDPVRLNDSPINLASKEPSHPGGTGAETVGLGISGCK
mmetsp:Transcript_16544/g.33816  ORF Transcript_16544/g.33816 Transcript_16544/m.33816 type:complete len:201 (-) Transcript_16544:2820-3422(-)